MNTVLWFGLMFIAVATILWGMAALWKDRRSERDRVMFEEWR